MYPGVYGGVQEGWGVQGVYIGRCTTRDGPVQEDRALQSPPYPTLRRRPKLHVVSPSARSTQLTEPYSFLVCCRACFTSGSPSSGGVNVTEEGGGDR